MKRKLIYNGLETRRITVVQQNPLLAASVRNNKLKVGNNGWQHESGDEVTLGNTLGSSIDADTHFDLTFE